MLLSNLISLFYLIPTSSSKQDNASIDTRFRQDYDGCRFSLAALLQRPKAQNFPHRLLMVLCLLNTASSASSQTAVANSANESDDVMSFIENASHFSLGDGVYTNVHGNIYNFYNSKRRREEIEDGSDLVLLTRRAGKRRRLNEDVGIKIIRSKKLKLIREIGGGPGYLLHTGQKKGDTVIVKVFNPGPDSAARRQLESVVALSKGIMHPNVLRLLGMSSPESLSHFIVYENAHRQNAEGPLAVALKNDLDRSIWLGFKMIEGLSAGMNHLSVHGLSLGSMRVENFDIFLDLDDRFVICPHPPSLVEGDTAQEQEESAWTVLNALCQKTLMSANRVLHHDEINRDSAILDVVQSRPAASKNPGESLLPSGPALASLSLSKNTQEDELDIPPRREYVWRKMNRGQQSLATVASRIALDLDMNLSSLRRMTWTDGRSAHRCAGYVREEITLATTTLDSAVVAHNAPGPSELCPICHEVVGLYEMLWCACGDFDSGSQHTVKCRRCKFWSHSGCVRNLNNDFICALCRLSARESSAPFPDDPATLSGTVGEEAPISQRTEASFIHGNAFEFSPDPFLLPSEGHANVLLGEGFHAEERLDKFSERKVPVGIAPGRHAPNHLRRVKGRALHVCPLCPADFTVKHNLNNHMRSHNSIKNFICGMCYRSFYTKYVLKRHELICP
ncbi:hypothetical protein DFH08DRAFT_292102 [Mycena albidolilacea]|uniref:C2H2-type domain-containing protein n=1 Tax=Mycena albidolilacea TaxID=1033008 RepID=A0AAD7EL84_9AGAR|nr:hypothetical protein DFH08DRAFT_292102 [Mycena albidolilacea]